MKKILAYIFLLISLLLFTSAIVAIPPYFKETISIEQCNSVGFKIGHYGFPIINAIIGIALALVAKRWLPKNNKHL